MRVLSLDVRIVQAVSVSDRVPRAADALRQPALRPARVRLRYTSREPATAALPQRTYSTYR